MPGLKSLELAVHNFFCSPMVLRIAGLNLFRTRLKTHRSNIKHFICGIKKIFKVKVLHFDTEIPFFLRLHYFYFLNKLEPER